MKHLFNVESNGSKCETKFIDYFLTELARVVINLVIRPVISVLHMFGGNL